MTWKKLELLTININDTSLSPGLIILDSKNSTKHLYLILLAEYIRCCSRLLLVLADGVGVGSV